jgi:hypothetical protein
LTKHVSFTRIWLGDQKIYNLIRKWAGK